MPKYRKKPVVIEAKQLTEYNQVGIMLWCGGEKADDGGVVIDTLEGKHLARIGDFVIEGVNGEYYPCKPEIFEKTYEKAE